MVGKRAVTTAVMKVGSLVDNLVENWVANLAASSESLLAGLMVVRKVGLWGFPWVVHLAVPRADC